MHGRPPVRDPAGASFGALRERAARLLAETDQPVTDDALARALLGTTSAGRWVQLLETVLGEDGRFLRDGGSWRLSRRGGAHADVPVLLAGESNQGCAVHTGSGEHAVDGPICRRGPAGTFVAVALATTGADPHRHRIVRIAAVRRSPDGALARLDLTINPGRRLPRYLRTAARLVHADLDAAPAFAEIVPALRELLDGQDVYAYGAAWVRAFLDAELARAGLPGLACVAVEIDDLARACLPPDRKPGLSAAAAALGIVHARPGFPLADAEAAARVVAALRARTVVATPAASETEDRAGNGYAAEAADRPLPFSRAWLGSVPSGPGVYLVEDADGTALYIGKAADLRRRLAAYVGPAPGLHRRLEALAVRARSVTILPTPSDLEATLLEARLIRERQPAFNVARQTRDARTIIRAAPHARRPRVQLVSAAAADGATYFGPFQSVRAAQRALATARQVYPAAFARTVSAPEEVERTRAAILAVCRLLAGQKEPALDELRRRMAKHAACGDGATVDRLRCALREVQSLELRPSPLAGLPDDWALLVFEGGTEESTGRPCRAHLLRHGRLVGSADADPPGPVTSDDAADAWALAAEIQRRATGALASPEPARDDAGALPSSTDDAGTLPSADDEPTIVRRWLAQSAASIRIVTIPPAALTGSAPPG